MSESLLPPLVLEMRAHASQLIGEVRTAAGEVGKAAESSEASAAKIESAWAGASSSMRAQVLSAQAAVESSTARVSAARQAHEAQAQRVAAAEKELAEAIAKEGATSEKAIAAERELAEAKTRLETASARVAAAEKTEEAAKERQIAANSKLIASSEATGGVLMSLGKKVALGTGLAAAAVGVASLKMAGDFQAQVNRLETAAGESHDHLKMVGDGILTVARATGTSSTELAQGMYMIESAGFHGADGLNVLKAAAQGAKNEGADMQGVGNALTTVMNDLGAKSGEAATIMSQMVAAVGQGKMKMDDLAGSIHSVLPNAAALGLNFEQVGGALATMTGQGVSADQAAQNLNHTIVKLAAPTQAMTNAMAAYGVNSSELKNNLGPNGLTGTFDILSKAILDHMGPAGLALQDTFNKSKVAAADAQKMLANLPPALQATAKGFLEGSVGQKEFAKAGKELGAAGSAQAAQFMKVAQTANGFSDALKSGKDDAQTFSQAMYSMLGDQTGLQVALHLTGDHLQTFKDNVKVIEGAAADAKGNVKDWEVTQGNFNTQLGRFKETVQTAAIAIGEKLLPAATKVFGFLADHQGVVIAVAAAIGGVLVAATIAWTVAMATATVTIGSFTIAALPLVAIIFGIIAAVALIGFAVYEFATHWHQIWGAITHAASAAWSYLKGAASDFVGHWSRAWHAVAGAASAVWRGITGAASAFGHAVADAVMGGVHKVEHMWSAAWGTVKAVFAGVTHWVQDHAARIVGAIFLLAPPLAIAIAAVHWLWGHWRDVWQWVVDKVHWAGGQLAAAASWVSDNMIRPLANDASWLGDRFADAWHWLVGAAHWAGGELSAAGRWITGNVIHPLAVDASWVGDRFADAWHWIVDRAEWAGGKLSAAADWVGDNVIHPLAQAAGWLGDRWSDIWGGITGAVQSAWDTISGIVDKIRGAISSVTGAIGSATGGALDGIGHMLGFDNGGRVPGPMGAPMLAVVHGGEYVLSNEMQSGRQAIDDDLLSSARSANPYTPAPAAPAAQPAAPGGGQTINVYPTTNASPARIAADIGWKLRSLAA